MTRKSDGAVLFNTTLSSTNATYNGLIFEDQYLEISTQLVSNASLYGLMESTQSNGFRVNTNGYFYTLWNRDTPSATTNQNLYGSHPFYMQLSDSGNAHGVLLLNSNGMDVYVQPESLTYRVIGGVLDFYIFSGPSPDQVVSQYSSFVGLPHLPPYWSLGFHQSKYGYPNIEYVEQVVANYSAAGIPLDTIWSDIDYMDEYEDFTWDPVNYPLNQVQTFIQQLHSNNQQYVVIVDPGIKVQSGYAPYDDLISWGAYIKDYMGQPFQGQVWPGYTIFPDFFNPNGGSYWFEQISTFLKQVPYDGLWIDMNEISNFCQGECQGNNPSFAIEEEKNIRPSAQQDMYNNPPYLINNGGAHNPLNVKTLDMNATHYVNVLEYNAHNLFGLTEAMATKQSLEKFYGKRSFVLSRSTFVSSGKWTAHWTGDNASQWPDLYYSIVGMLNFNVLGIPNIGSDICGFLDNTTEELCSRWIQVGAFYPFSRDHDDISSTSQELYRWPQVATISRQVLGIRYSILSYYYTLFFHAAVNGTSVVRPLLFQFPKDTNTRSIDKQFLIGNAIMVSPVLTQGATSVSAYFPAAVWYDFYNQSRITTPTNGGYMTLSAPVTFVPLHILGGTIFSHESANLTTAVTRLNPFSLLVALDQNGRASGDIYVDDGTTIVASVLSKMQFAFTQFSASMSAGKGTFTSKNQLAGYKGSSVNMALLSIRVLGVTTSPSSVSLGGKPVPFTFSSQYGYMTVDLSSQSLRVDSSFQLSWQ